MPTSGTFKLNIDIDPKGFRKRLSDRLKDSSSELFIAINESVTEVLGEKLEAEVKAGRILSFKIKPYPYRVREFHSLKDVVKKGDPYPLHYFTVHFTLPKDRRFTPAQIVKPKCLAWKGMYYGHGVTKSHKFKRISQKTQDRYEIQFLGLAIPLETIKGVFKGTSKNCSCDRKQLVGVLDETWDWRVRFSCGGCGQDYMCSCFKQTMKNDPADASDYDWIKGVKFKAKICHICTNTPSNLFYCSPMYGSDVMVRYGSYAKKYQIDLGLDKKAAENRVRDFLKVPRIGEGWINETGLFNLVSFLLPQHKVIREASPAWLGKQRLDIYIPTLNLAIEYHGQQHFQPVERFGGHEAFLRGQERDKLKKKLCTKNGVKLVVFTYKEDMDERLVKKKLKPYLKAST